MVTSILSFHKASLQVEIDRFSKFAAERQDNITTFTKSAFSQARQKLKPSAFIALRNEQLQYFDAQAPHKKNWKSFRVIAIDGSSLNLPPSPCLSAHFGVFKNQNTTASVGAKVSIAYDVCNQLILDATISSIKDNEHDLARQHLGQLQPYQDLLLFDRGYPSISFAKDLDAQGFKFCFRLSTAWKEVCGMLSDTKKDDLVWHLNKGRRYKIKGGQEVCLAQNLNFRVVKVALDNGASEVLLTNLEDTETYPASIFKELYHMRWGVEECYKRIKQVSQLEFFSGKTVHAIEQDFHARIVLLNIASMIETQELQPQLDVALTPQSRKHKIQVNRMQVNAKLKDFLWDILYTTNSTMAIQKMLKLLRNAYDIVRENRHFQRNKSFKHKRKPLNYKAF